MGAVGLCLFQVGIIAFIKRVFFFKLIEKTCLLSSFCPRSSVRHKVAEEKDLSSSWQDGIPVKETAASLLVCGGLCAEGFRNTLSLLSRELWG